MENDVLTKADFEKVIDDFRSEIANGFEVMDARFDEIERQIDLVRLAIRHLKRPGLKIVPMERRKNNG